MAGYSSRSLVEKLGIKSEMSICMLNAPESYLHQVKRDFASHKIDDQILNKKDYDFIQFFTRSYQDLEERFPNLKKSLHKTGMLWVCWPKSSCSFATTDLAENTVRKIGLENGLVDIKVIAIDKDWSGLKFVYRLKDR